MDGTQETTNLPISPSHLSGLNHLPVKEHTVVTPTDCSFDGQAFEGRICGISIMRAGESMEQGLRDCCRYLDGLVGATRMLTTIPTSLSPPLVRVGRCVLARF